jgi:hypothetical protein
MPKRKYAARQLMKAESWGPRVHAGEAKPALSLAACSFRWFIVLKALFTGLL